MTTEERRAIEARDAESAPGLWNGKPYPADYDWTRDVVKAANTAEWDRRALLVALRECEAERDMIRERAAVGHVVNRDQADRIRELEARVGNADDKRYDAEWSWYRAGRTIRRLRRRWQWERRRADSLRGSLNEMHEYMQEVKRGR